MVHLVRAGVYTINIEVPRVNCIALLLQQFNPDPFSAD